MPGLDQVNTSTAEALTVVTALHLPKNILDFECFEEEIYKESAEEYLILNYDKFNIKPAISEHIIFIVSKSLIKRVYIGSLISLRRGGFVIKGRIRSDKGCFSLLRPTKKKIESIDDAILLIFPHNFSNMLKHIKNISDAFAEYYIKNAKKKTNDQGFFKKEVEKTPKKSKFFNKLMNSMVKLTLDSLDKMLNS